MATVAPRTRGPTRSPQRQTGFCVPAAAAQGGVAGSAADGDTDMDDQSAEQPRQQPMAIPKLGASPPAGAVSLPASSHSPAELPTPPDGVSLAPGSRGLAAPVGAARAVPSKPGTTPTLGSFGAGGASSSGAGSWDARRTSAQHLFSLSASSRSSAASNSGARLQPYLSTSYRTSAERGGDVDDDDDDDDSVTDDMEMDEADDVFGWSPRGLSGASPSVTSGGAPERLQATRYTSATPAPPGDADDSAGVFSFSSPCFEPRSLENGDGDVDSLAPPTPPSPPLPASNGSGASSGAARLSASAARARRLMSPGWTAATLSRMTLGSPEVSSSPNGGGAGPSSRPSRPPLSGSSASAFAVQSRSLPSSAGGPLTAAQQRRLSFGRRPPLPLASNSYSYTQAAASGSASPASSGLYVSRTAAASASRSRSRSRQRTVMPEGTPRLSSSAALEGEVDDDETDDEMLLDDADGGGGGAYGLASQATIRGRRAPSVEASPNGRGASALSARLMPPHSAQQAAPWTPQPTTTMSASFERAYAHMAPGGSALARGYSSERHHYSHGHHAPSAGAHALALSRHHPYATSPGGAGSPLTVGGFAAYSPSGAAGARPINRRGSSQQPSSAGFAGTPPASSLGAGTPGSLYGASPRIVSTGTGPPLYAYGDEATRAAGGAFSPPAAAAAASLTPSRSLLSTSASSRGSAHSSQPRRASRKSRGGAESAASDDDSTAPETASTTPATGSSVPRSAAPLSSASNTTSVAGENPEMTQVNAIRERLGGAANCSAFISKLWYLMCHPELYAQYIRWSEAGDSIILFSDTDVANEFAAEVLPRLFKHGNNASFVRQLNLYGFQRVPSSRLLDAAEQKAAKRPGGLRGVSGISTALQLYGPHSSFAHPRFLKDEEQRLPSMKPRSSKKPKKGAAAAVPAAAAADTSAAAESDDEDDLAL